MSTAATDTAEAPLATSPQIAENELAPLFTLPCTGFSNASLSLHTDQAKVSAAPLQCWPTTAAMQC